MKANDNRPPTTTHSDRRYFLLEGIARNESSRAATKKNIVSLVSNPIPTTNPAGVQSLGSRRLTILTIR